MFIYIILKIVQYVKRLIGKKSTVWLHFILKNEIFFCTLYYFIVIGGYYKNLGEYSPITTSNMHQGLRSDDKKLKDILNVHPKCNETCIDVAIEEICKFIKNVCNAIWIFNTIIWNYLNNNNVELVNMCKTHSFYYVYDADLMYYSLEK